METVHQPKPDRQSSDDVAGIALGTNALDLQGRYHHTSRKEQTVGQAANIAEQDTLVTSDQDTCLPRYYNDIKLILRNQHHQTERSGTLQHAIEAFHQALDLNHKSISERLQYLDNLSSMLNDAGHHEESLAISKELLFSCAENHESRSEFVNNFCCILFDVCTHTGSVDELEQGLDIVRQSMDSLPQNDPGRAQCLSNFASLLHAQYGIRRGDCDPTEAVRVAKDAVVAVAEDCVTRAVCLNRLARILTDKFHYTRLTEDIDEAVEMDRMATAGFYNGDTDRKSRCFDLAYTLAIRSAATGSLEDLSEGIEIAQRVIEDLPDDHERRFPMSIRLASWLRERHIWAGSQSDFDEALRVMNTGLSLAPEDHPKRAHAFYILGNVMSDRYSREGSLEDLDEAIKYTQKAVEATLPSDTEWPNFISSLASGFSDRYIRTGGLADLDEAIRLCESALEQTRQTALSWMGLFHRLGGLYRNRYLRLWKAADLEKSIKFSQMTIDRCGRGDQHRHLYFTSLAGALKLRFDRHYSMEDLNTAIGLERNALEATPNYHADYPVHLHEIGTSMFRKFKQTNDLQYLNEAIRYESEALETMDEKHRRRAEYLDHLGSYFQERGAATGNEDDCRESSQLYQRAMSQTQSSVRTRVVAGRTLMYSYMARSEWNLAYEAAVFAINLMPKLILRSLGKADKQELLKQISGLSSDAAGLALQLGKPPMEALDMLEKGRGLVVSSLDDLHSDLDILQDSYPDLAAQFISLRDKLGSDDVPTPEITSAWNQDSDQRHDASEKFDTLIDEIRQQPGFEDFLLPPTESQIKQAAEQGPIIVVNICLIRCDAILIEPHQIRAIPLAQFSRSRMTNFIQEGTLRSSLALEWLWTCIASPVLGALGFTKPPDGDWPRVWWVMTGLLARFPIHAAGYHAKGSSDTVPDRVVSSYQTSVRSIVRGRKRPTTTTLQQALLIGMDVTPGSSNLPNASKEVLSVRHVCESMSMRIVEPKPVKAEITSQLLRSDIFHYAGHAYTDRHEPVESYLCLEVNKKYCLTVSNLMDLNLQRQAPFLAYLSACGTGEIQNEDLTDEGIHLITAFQLLGFRHVIGTLWAVMDSLCIDFAKLVYQHLRDHRTTDRAVAEGLHHATRKLRDNWLNTKGTQREMLRRKGTEQADDGVKNKETREAGASVSMRDVILCDDDVAWPDWIPYVHFGL